MLKTKIEGFDEVQEVLKEYREGGALELKQYRTIGTVEECREARERQRGKKPEFELNLSDYTSRFVCECGKRVIVKHDSGVMDNHDAPNYCSNCGQRFDWSETV